MAIPVANPPPSEPPPSGGGSYGMPPGMPEGAPPAAPPGGGGSSMSPVVRGCLIAAGFGSILACLGMMALAYSCAGLLSMGTNEAVHNIADAYRTAAVRAGEESTYDADLRQFVVLGEENRITFVALGILSNRYEDARRDGIIDTDELHHGMELVHDVVIGNGTVDMQSYPEGR